jgi:hypothetical protein
VERGDVILDFKKFRFLSMGVSISSFFDTYEEVASGLLSLCGHPGQLQHALRVPSCIGVAKVLEEWVSLDVVSLTVYRCSLSKMEVRAWREIVSVGRELQAVLSLIACCAVSLKWKIRAQCAAVLVGEEVQAETS